MRPSDWGSMFLPSAKNSVGRPANSSWLADSLGSTASSVVLGYVRGVDIFAMELTV